MSRRGGLALALALALVACLGVAPAQGKAYKRGDAITLYANKVGPFQNPTETYQFYNLPFCQPAGGKEYKLEDLGEVRGSQRGASANAWGVAGSRDSSTAMGPLCAALLLSRCWRVTAWSIHRTS